MNGFSRDAQLQATVNARCWHKALVLHTMSWKSPINSRGRTLFSTLCSKEELSGIAWKQNFCYISVKKLLKVCLQFQGRWMVHTACPANRAAPVHLLGDAPPSPAPYFSADLDTSFTGKTT
jgi:hypothetical protein